MLKVKVLKSLKEKSIGLIGVRDIYPVYFETRGGIHTFGMLAPLDVVILDNQNRVVKLKENLKPNRVFFWNPIYSRVVELPIGTIVKEKIQIGEKILL